MKSNRILLAILATSLLIMQPGMVAEPAQKQNVSLVQRANREYQAFKEAYRCAREKGIRNCSRAQKTRLIGAGIALVLIVASIAYGGYRDVRGWRLKQEARKEE